MKAIRSLFRPFATALLAASLLAPGLALAGFHASVTGRDEPKAETFEFGMELAQSGGCYAIGERMAAQHGGTVARADVATEGGQQVCVIVIVVLAKDGQRGRRLEFTVPQN